MSLARAAGLALGALADRALGDPARGHPVAGLGRLAAALEARLWRPSRAAGALHAGVLVGGAAVLLRAAERRAARRPGGETALLAAVTWAALGGRSLEREGRALADLVAAGDLAAARRRARSLVGRDPAALDGPELSRAAVESLAENAADAVVGPLLWGALTGSAGVAAYRTANTLDAMVGHRSPRYARFGWAAARLDDALTWPAARLGALLAVALAPAVGGRPRAALAVLRRDGARHPSPNAGRLEAAFAGALATRLGGTNAYGARAARRRRRRGARRRRRRGSPVSGLRLHGDRLAAPGLLDLAVNVHDAPRPGGLDAALAAALAARSYPDADAATAALARRHGRPPEEVLPLNGACEAFWLLAHALRPAVAACVHPSFTEPDAALRAAGARVLRIQRDPDGWRLPPPEALPEDAEVVVLGHPDNPTGVLDPAPAVAALARPGRLLVVDESFIDVVPGERESLAARRDLPGPVVVRSLTKLWALPGVRAGHLLAPADLVARLAAQRQPWSVNALALAALEHCAADRATPTRVAAEVVAAREDLRARLEDVLGLVTWPSAANFVLARGPAGVDLAAGLRRRGIAVRPARTFPGLCREHVRITVRGPAEHARLVRELRALLPPRRSSSPPADR